jgi:hypothetical protein
MILKRGPLEIEFEWDHGPDLSIVFYGHRTHILSASWSAYPVLGSAKDTLTGYSDLHVRFGAKDPLDPHFFKLGKPHFFGPLERMVKAAYEITHDPLTEAIEEGLLNADTVFDHDARTLKLPNGELYELTFYPPGDKGMRRLMESLPPPGGNLLSPQELMDKIWQALGPHGDDEEYKA